jgi:hypothetical protein
MGLPPYEGWGDEWSRNASATQMYLKANRPQPAVEVPLHFLRGTELLQIEQSTCDPCFYHNQPLVGSLPLLRQLLDFWHSDCGHDAIQPCASAYVIVVDDEDHEADEDLLRMLAARMWDKPLPDIKSELLHRCASVDEPASLLAAWALEKPGQTAAGWRGRSTAGGTSAPRSHRQVGCMLLRDRYNTRVRQFWQPRKVDMDEREEKVRPRYRKYCLARLPAAPGHGQPGGGGVCDRVHVRACAPGVCVCVCSRLCGVDMWP